MIAGVYFRGTPAVPEAMYEPPRKRLAFWFGLFAALLIEAAVIGLALGALYFI